MIEPKPICARRATFQIDLGGQCAKLAEG
ncbi:MAG: hypothetical protein QOG78_918, partial [Rhodospirillaceae bacterium]|nr:hypothetical protein [Rhodospirillaceae bacterium]